jgi:hypothetical protein
MSTPFSAGLSFALFLNSSKTLPLAITNSTAQVITWNAAAAADLGSPNWLSLDRVSGNLIAHEVQTIYVTAQSGQVIGDFSGKLTFTPSVGAGEVLSAELHVSRGVYSDNGPKAPAMLPSRFDFNTQLGIMGPSQLQVTSNPDELNDVNWTMTSKVNWLSVNPNNGAFQRGVVGVVGVPQNVNVTANPGALVTAGTYTTDLILTLTFSNATMAATHESTSILIPISVVVP